MPRWIGFAAVGILVAVFAVHHQCSASVPTGRTITVGVDASHPAAQVIPVYSCTRWSEQVPLRIMWGVLAAIGLAALFWSVGPSTRTGGVGFAKYLADEVGASKKTPEARKREVVEEARRQKAIQDGDESYFREGDDRWDDF